jgi:hypothetical protein
MYLRVHFAGYKCRRHTHVSEGTFVEYSEDGFGRLRPRGGSEGGGIGRPSLPE